MTVRPDSGAVLPNLKGDLVIQFNEVIDEMPGSSGGASGISGLAKLVTLSPVAGDLKVSSHPSAIHLHPHQRWQRGRAYPPAPVSRLPHPAPTTMHTGPHP